MNVEGVEMDKKGPVAHLRVTGPEGGSPSVVQWAGDVSERLGMLGWHEDARVVVFESKEEGAFCVEEDTLSELCEGPGVGGVSSIADGLAGMGAPVIAGIEGDATGPGLEWILACDLRIASETSRFGLPQVKAGVMPWEGGTQRLARLVGRGKALEMILTGDRIDAKEALRIGLVNRVVPRGEVSKAVTELARDMASKSPVSTRYAKEAICKGLELSLEQGLRLEADLYYLMHTTRDRTEGIRAFQEKRKPHFEGK